MTVIDRCLIYAMCGASAMILICTVGLGAILRLA